VITLVPLTGFLGAGKTTTLISAAIAMQRTGRRVAVVTNDPGSNLVDTQLARSGLDDVSEVAGGCLCDRFEELAAIVSAVAESGRTDVILVEAAGNCAGLREAVLNPLRRRFGDRLTVAPLTVLVDPVRLAAFSRAADRAEPMSDLARLFGQQLAEADVLVLNKVDLIGAEQSGKVQARLAAAQPGAVVLPFSATTGAGMDTLLWAWRQPADSEDRDGEREVDRDGEFGFGHAGHDGHDGHDGAGSALAWLNQPVQVTAVGDVFDALGWGRAVLRHLSDWSGAAGYLLGHAKVAVRTSAGLAKLSVTEAGTQPRVDRTAARPIKLGSATVNVRALCPPDALDAAVLAALLAADALAGTRSSATLPTSFQPVHPGPSPHDRIAAVR
jgi:G3E family GTPase